MKTKITSLRTFGIGLAVVISFAFSTGAMANKTGSEKPSVEFKFVGNLRDLPVYQLDLSNGENEEFTITIRDHSGSILYFDRVKGQNICRKFQFSPEGIEDDVLRVEVRAKNSNQSHVYEINKVSRYIQENVVTKLK